MAVVKIDNTPGPVHDVTVPLVAGVVVRLTTDRHGLETPFVQVETDKSVPLYAASLGEPRTLRLAAGKYRVRFMDYRSQWGEKTLLVEDKDMTIAIP